MKKIKKSCATKMQQKLTSTPTKTSAEMLSQSHFNMSNISTISTSTTVSDKVSSRGDPSKEVSVSQDDLEYAHNMYLLALATTKLQEQALSEVTAENENQKLTLLSEVERKRCYLAALKIRYKEVTYLSQQTELLRCSKEKLGPLMDFVSDGLKSMEPLKNALDCGLPVKGFQTEKSACNLKNSLCESSKMLEKMCAATCEHGTLYSETGQEIAGIQHTVTSIAEAQNRCDVISTALSHAVLKESSMKVMKQRNMKWEDM